MALFWHLGRLTTRFSIALNWLSQQAISFNLPCSNLSDMFSNGWEGSRCPWTMIFLNISHDWSISPFFCLCPLVNAIQASLKGPMPLASGVIHPHFSIICFELNVISEHYQCYYQKVGLSHRNTKAHWCNLILCKYCRSIRICGLDVNWALWWSL